MNAALFLQHINDIEDCYIVKYAQLTRRHSTMLTLRIVAACFVLLIGLTLLYLRISPTQMIDNRDLINREFESYESLCEFLPQNHLLTSIPLTDSQLRTFNYHGQYSRNISNTSDFSQYHSISISSQHSNPIVHCFIHPDSTTYTYIYQTFFTPANAEIETLHFGNTEVYFLFNPEDFSCVLFDYKEDVYEVRWYKECSKDVILSFLETWLHEI